MKKQWIVLGSHFFDQYGKASSRLLIKLTIFTDCDRTFCKLSGVFLEASVCLWRKQWVHSVCHLILVPDHCSSPLLLPRHQNIMQCIYASRSFRFVCSVKRLKTPSSCTTRNSVYFLKDPSHSYRSKHKNCTKLDMYVEMSNRMAKRFCKSMPFH